MADGRVKRGLSKASAAVWFVVGYVAINILAVGLSLTLESLMHVKNPASPTENPAYVLAEKFIPLINLAVWTAAGGLYFRKQTASAASSREAWMLGAAWLVASVIVDFVGFVVIRNPLSLTPREFYVGQFPWIYLIYLTVLVGPICAWHLKKRFADQ